jgi:NADH-quinone oxidoreductase subunit E
MSLLEKKFSAEITRILANYPPDQRRAAVMPLLHLAQQQDGFVTRLAMQEIAELTETTITDVASVVGYYTLYHDAPEGKIRLQVCTDVACDLRGAREYLASLCSELGIKPGETTTDGLVTIEEVKCLAACDHAPMFQSQINGELEYHENQTPARTLDWLKSMSGSLSNPVVPVEPSPKSNTSGGANE